MENKVKCIAKVRQENADSGSFLKRFNGKPMLIKESSSVKKGVTEEGIRFLEYNVNSKLCQLKFNAGRYLYRFKILTLSHPSPLLFISFSTL